MVDIRKLILFHVIKEKLYYIVSLNVWKNKITFKLTQEGAFITSSDKSVLSDR